MIGEIPQPEQGSVPEEDTVIEARPFDVDAMGDDQIIVLYRGLNAIGLLGRLDGDSFDEFLVVSDLRDRLVASVRELASRDPERVKNLISRSAPNAQEADREFAAFAAPSLVHFDYEFTRDTLIFLMVDQTRQEISGSPVCEVAWDETRFMMRDHMTAEQIADFNAHLAAYERHLQIQPALPDER